MNNVSWGDSFFLSTLWASCKSVWAFVRFLHPLSPPSSLLTCVEHRPRYNDSSWEYSNLGKNLWILLLSQTFPNLISALFLMNVLFSQYWYVLKRCKGKLLIWIPKILMFTEWIMAFAESETLVRSLGVAGNWSAMKCKKLICGFFSPSNGYFLASIKRDKIRRETAQVAVRLFFFFYQHVKWCLGRGAKGCNSFFDSSINATCSWSLVACSF